MPPIGCASNLQVAAIHKNLIGSVSEQDVVNLFVGFLTGPEEQVLNPDGSVADHRLQKAVHGVAGC